MVLAGIERVRTPWQNRAQKLCAIWKGRWVCGFDLTRRRVLEGAALLIDLVKYRVQNRVMIKLNIHEAKTHLSRYLDRVLAGESIILCRRNVPIAEIRRLPTERQEERPVGLAAGEFEISRDFFEPLPDDVMTSFYEEES